MDVQDLNFDTNSTVKGVLRQILHFWTKIIGHEDDWSLNKQKLKFIIIVSCVDNQRVYSVRARRSVARH